MTFEQKYGYEVERYCLHLNSAIGFMKLYNKNNDAELRPQIALGASDYLDDVSALMKAILFPEIRHREKYAKTCYSYLTKLYGRYSKLVDMYSDFYNKEYDNYPGCYDEYVYCVAEAKMFISEYNDLRD